MSSFFHGSHPASTFVGCVTVGLPLLGKKIKAMSPENDIFFIIKAFAAGVILATGFIHILPDAFDSLTSPCLAQNPWGGFLFTGFVAMMTAIGRLMVDSFATGFYKRMHFNRSKPVSTTDEEKADEEHEGHVHVHTHATHGHAHGYASPMEDLALNELIRRRIVSQVLELGIVVHSVIIGIWVLRRVQEQ